ncbi:hypothetical protein RBU49_15450 [Clostridium sp. MB40-C1]|uniref:hypothetical protein n=1 Tax=Clostridium sp. MB40-C1 TaxID=3070996 RepID=UPI0027DF8F74|nr:hypothetical protein [Clostridium sp. MB40-C1]WMJ80199.1 hypothetical protein RBU49_15450 [Clostridium sp. MB40-C1]
MNSKTNYAINILKHTDWPFIIVLLGILATPFFTYSFIVSVIASLFIKEETIKN